MADEAGDRPVVPISGWWMWVVVAVGIVVVILIIAGAWRLWRRLSQSVSRQVPVTQIQPQQTDIRLISTPTEIIIDDSPIIPEGEVSLEAINTHFQDYQGKPVTVSGSIVDFGSAVYFAIEQGQDKIRIMALSESIEENQLEEAENPERQYVQVTGTVKLLTRKRRKEGFGFEFSNLKEAFWHDQVIIEAKTITITDTITT
ncbi:MAG: hypothetical protein COU66_00125 [Candidatus Pacebacteria bacterium CG10_big_fil_rev_8_21_14_0_10_44_11]|nr:MAG: hypothetical protein COU66_00125 [Candidatus Pacebacteria bacterium CG10_big_fil_rev_8_21_14_0_10_44_11]